MITGLPAYVSLVFMLITGTTFIFVAFTTYQVLQKNSIKKPDRHLTCYIRLNTSLVGRTSSPLLIAVFI